jgi:hypothetical protein
MSTLKQHDRTKLASLQATRWRCQTCGQPAEVQCDQQLAPVVGQRSWRVCRRRLCRRCATVVGPDQHRCPKCVGGDVVTVGGDGNVLCGFCRGKGCAACFNLRRQRES